MGHYNPKKDKKIMNKLTREQLEMLESIKNSISEAVERITENDYLDIDELEDLLYDLETDSEDLFYYVKDILYK